MNHKILATFLFSALISGICLAQTSQSVVEDFKTTPTTQSGKQYPQVNSEGRVRTSISAPEAKKVQIDIGAVKYDLTKDENGVWTGESAPQDEGFHYYQLNIDGASVPDPGSLYFYGASRWGSGIEIPAKDQDFYALKNVPHGQFVKHIIIRKQLIVIVMYLFTRHQDMIMETKNILFYTYNMVWVKMKPDGATRDMLILLWTI